MAIQFNSEHQSSVIITECKNRRFSSLSGRKKNFSAVLLERQKKWIQRPKNKDTSKQSTNGCLKERLLLFLQTGHLFITRQYVLSLIPSREGTQCFISTFSLRCSMFCGKGHSCLALLNPPATAGQQTRTRTPAEKRLHHELSGGWFDLPPQRPTCAELQHLSACFLFST